MKPLTKTDFILARHGDTEYSRLSKLLTNDDVKQLLKNQEDAKEYWKIIDEFVRLNKLEERLKKEFIDCDEYPPLTKWFNEILEGKE